MSLILTVILSTILLPASSIYNSYVSRNMSVDVPAAFSGPAAPIRKYAKPVFIRNGNEKAVLMIHGFSGSPRDFGNLPELFEAAGYDVIVPLLPEHGRGARALHYGSAKEWLEFVSNQYEEVRKAYKEVILIGLSLGASLSVLTAAKHAAAPPDRLILLSPFFKVRQKWYYVFPVETYQEVLAHFVPYVQSLPGQSSVCSEKVKKNNFVSRQYASTHATGEAFKIAKAARRYVRVIPRLKVPVLVMQSRQDGVTDYETTRDLIAGLSDPNIQMVTLERANHVLPRDCEAGVVEQQILGFAAA